MATPEATKIDNSLACEKFSARATGKANSSQSSGCMRESGHGKRDGVELFFCGM